MVLTAALTKPCLHAIRLSLYYRKAASAAFLFSSVQLALLELPVLIDPHICRFTGKQ